MRAIAGVEDWHPHWLRHTFATKLVMKGMDTMLARQITRHKSESSFARYSKRALELKAHQQFYEVLGRRNRNKLPMTTQHRLFPAILGCQTSWTVSSSIDYA